MNDELRGVAISTSKILNSEGNSQSVSTPIPEEYVGKNVVVRGEVITERIDS